jgi:archaellum biogenesis ATPase FlaH
MTSGRIRCFADIPDLLTMDIPPVEYVVPALGISRNSITLWTGPDGDGKTYLAQTMTAAIARGDEFLGMTCQRTPVLYVDLENAAHTVQARFQAITEECISNMRIWGIWNEQQPPQAGSELLLTIAKETMPVIVIDPFRYFHNAEENDSTAMAGVMQYLRACAAYGAAVILLHHPAKSEGSTGRGSSAIRGACDLAFLHSLDRESGLITLRVDKNRNGESRTITIKADFEAARFDVSEAPYITRRKDELSKIEEIIKANPGITQNGIAKASSIRRQRLPRVLEEGCGTLWHVQPGPNRAKLYYPRGTVVPSGSAKSDTSLNGAVSINAPSGGSAHGSGGVVVPVVRCLIGETTVPPTDHVAKNRGEECPACGRFKLYPGLCLGCKAEAEQAEQIH